MDESRQRRPLHASSSTAQLLDVDGPIIVDGPPVADLGGDVHDDVDVGECLGHEFRVAEFATVQAGPLAFPGARCRWSRGQWR